jgi:hypothetical protein
MAPGKITGEAQVMVLNCPTARGMVILMARLE